MTEPTGADLARQMLNTARAEARKRGTTPAARPKARRRTPRGTGREPQTLGSVLDQLADAFGWSRPTAGAQVIIRWPELAPDLVRLGAPERYDAESRTLHIRPVSPAAATHLRMAARQIAADLNERTGAATVAAVRVMPPGRTGTPAPDPAAPAAPAAAPAGPRSRGDASPGLLAAQLVVEAARDRVPRTIGGRSELADAPVLREPEGDFADAVALVESLAAQSVRDDDPRERALARARAEKAGRPMPVPRAFEQTA